MNSIKKHVQGKSHIVCNNTSDDPAPLKQVKHESSFPTSFHDSAESHQLTEDVPHQQTWFFLLRVEPYWDHRSSEYRLAKFSSANGWLMRAMYLYSENQMDKHFCWSGFFVKVNCTCSLHSVSFANWKYSMLSVRYIAGCVDWISILCWIRLV